MTQAREVGSLVERLRFLGDDLNKGYKDRRLRTCALLREAGDEIERLEAALQGIIDAPDMSHCESPSYYNGRDELMDIAYEALNKEQADDDQV